VSWQPPEGKLPGRFKLALVNDQGEIIASKTHSGDSDYSWSELEYAFQLRAKELARDFAALHG